MKLIGLIDEDFINYRKPSMVLEFPYCDFKCDKECGMQVCQNSKLASAPIIEVSQEYIIKRYIDSPITEAIVIQGLEPFHDNNIQQLNQFINEFRKLCSDDIVIYTGYNKSEIEDKLKSIYMYGEYNIIIKFGRYIPNQPSHHDEILGVNLASPNQYAERIC